jgi:hypothetical protein
VKKSFAKFAVIAAAGAAMIVPVAGIASAQGTDWGGFNNPGYHNPHGDDWHCDRHGNWHNDQRDSRGHRDNRCHVW